MTPRSAIRPGRSGPQSSLTGTTCFDKLRHDSFALAQVAAFCLIVAASNGSLSAGTVTTDAVAVALGCSNVQYPGSCGYDNIQAVYNSASGSSINYPSLYWGSALGANGTANILGLNSSFDQATASNGVSSAFAYTSASIDSGTITAQLSTTGTDSQAAAGTELDVENLVFQAAGAGPSTTTTVDLNLLITGSLQGNSTADYAVASFLGLEVEWSAVDTPYFAANSPGSNWTIGCFTSSCISLQYAYTFTGPVGNFGTFDLTNNAFTCYLGDPCSEIYTEVLSMTLPGNVTYTSDSPTFLTAASTPEPGTFVLVAWGAFCGLLPVRLRGHWNTRSR